MEFDLHRFAATFAGYVLPLTVLFVATAARPSLWHEPRPEPAPRRPILELALALLTAVAIFGFNILFNTGRLLPNDLGSLGYVLNLLIIWSPLVVVLVWRRQGLETCLLVLDDWWKKLLWGVACSVVGMAVYLLVLGRFADLPLAVTLLGAVDPIMVFQSLVQFVGVGFLFYRLVGAIGSRWAVSICAMLYGLVKYPYYLNGLGLGFAEATSIIAFSILVAFFVIWVIYRRLDVIVAAILHVFMDLVLIS